MKYLRNAGLYQKRYDQLYKENVLDNGKSSSIIGEFLRLITKIYIEVVREQSAVYFEDGDNTNPIIEQDAEFIFSISREEYDFLTNQRYIFKVNNEEDTYDYFLYKLYEQSYFHWEDLPTNFEPNFTFTLDNTLDCILKAHGNIEDTHKESFYT